MRGQSTSDAERRRLAASPPRGATPAVLGSAAIVEAALRGATAICRALDWCVGRVWIRDAQPDAWRLAASWGHPDPCVSASDLSDARSDAEPSSSRESLLAEAVRVGTPVWRDVRRDPRFDDLPPGSPLQNRTLYAAPASIDGEVIAVLEFLADARRDDDPTLEALTALAIDQVSLAARTTRLEAERARLAEVVEQAAQPIFTVSREGTIRTWNCGAARAYGFSTEEALGAPLAALSPPNACGHAPEIARAVAAGRRLKRCAAVRRHKDGRLFDVLTTVTPIRDAAGGVIGATLAEQVEPDLAFGERREHELEQARRASRRAKRLKTEFLANVSHELRTPMSAVIGMIELALGDDISAAARDYLTTAGDSARVMLALVNDLLDQTRMESGRFELECETFRIRRLLDDAMRGLSFRAHEAGLELAFEIAPDVPDLLEGDGRRFRQVVTNLVNNALKFTERGEIVVRVTLDARESDEAVLRCTVSDTGPGVAPEDQERIFAPFTQVDSSTTRRQTGAGLGLTIAREIAERMGGRMWCDPTATNGATFHFTARLKTLPDEPGVVDERLARLRGASVLIVDDNATNRRILESIVLGWELRPLLVDNGWSAIAAIEEAQRVGRPFPLVVVDALMPEMDGFTLVETLREKGLTDAATILMLSSADRETFETRCENLPISRYLEKPVSPRALLEAVIAALPGDAVAETHQHGEPPARPLSLLVVEDTPANQKVVQAILQKHGHQVCVAGNGREALEVYKRREFDVVLMDIQMPTMDGFQTTAAIRALEDRRKASAPIVAMTAHAMAGDRLRCLRAGMDNYIAKPIDADELAAVVQRAVRRPSAGGPASGSQALRETPAGDLEETLHASPASPDGRNANGRGVNGANGRISDASRGSNGGPSPDAADHSLETPMSSPMDVAAALKRFGGDRSLLRDIGQFFLEDAPQFLQALHAALEAGDAQEVERAAHCLKGLAANFNAVAMQEAAFAVERAGRQSNLAAAAPLVPDLEREVERVVAAVKTEIMGG